MKFRTIFILFNIVIVASFLFVFLLPLFLLGGDTSLAFWSGNWYLAIFFVALIAALNGFFLANRKVFVLVEREDWTALSAYLGERIYAKGIFKASHIRLLINAYLLQSNVDAIEKLEIELANKRPKLLRREALLFGVTRLLRNMPAEAEAFFARYLEAKEVESRDWLRFDYAFSLALQKRVSDALPFLREASRSRDAILSLLGAYLLGTLGIAAATSEEERTEIRAEAEASRARLRKRFPGPRWSSEVERAKNEVHIVILSKLIDDAGRWLFSADREAKA